ncbi:ead/Ea22-like family protein [Citrobacter sp. Cs237]|uniref:ead/Ea22-like family protein n=1 Tax=Citrobacter sp. Cs237 TaxID=2985156 RepID=UPI002577C678|nr:ead/Ea22-like family protein [Citrobacter sp. Cs237]MDM2751478.1 ead/Ea22-like family protein [Citrobacter sp. Cs237]
MTIDKQALREAAEKATPGRIGDRIDGSGSIKYECRGYDGSLVLRTDHKNMEYGFIGENGSADELFFRLCVPDVVLALLDELDSANGYASAYEAEKWHYHGLAESEGERADRAEKRIAEIEEIATDYGMKFQKAQDALKHQALLHKSQMEAAEKRIAELEALAKSVKFDPIPMDELGNKSDGKKHPYMFGAGYNSAVVHCESVLLQAFAAAGIGKGE